MTFYLFLSLRSGEKKESMQAFYPIPQPLGGNMGGAAKPRLERRGYQCYTPTGYCLTQSNECKLRGLPISYPYGVLNRSGICFPASFNPFFYYNYFAK